MSESLYQPTPEQVAQARHMDGATLRRVHGFARGFLVQPRWEAPRWYYVKTLCHCYLVDVSEEDAALALMLPVAAGTLQARNTPKGPQVRLAPRR
jgi:hypothetical protein